MNEADLRAADAAIEDEYRAADDAVSPENIAKRKRMLQSLQNASDAMPEVERQQLAAEYPGTTAALAALNAMTLGQGSNAIALGKSLKYGTKLSDERRDVAQDADALAAENPNAQLGGTVGGIGATIIPGAVAGLTRGGAAMAPAALKALAGRGAAYGGASGAIAGASDIHNESLKDVALNTLLGGGLGAVLGGAAPVAGRALGNVGREALNKAAPAIKRGAGSAVDAATAALEQLGSQRVSLGAGGLGFMAGGPKGALAAVGVPPVARAAGRALAKMRGSPAPAALPDETLAMLERLKLQDAQRASAPAPPWEPTIALPENTASMRAPSKGGGGAPPAAAAAPSSGGTYVDRVSSAERRIQHAGVPSVPDVGPSGAAAASPEQFAALAAMGARPIPPPPPSGWLPVGVGDHQFAVPPNVLNSKAGSDMLDAAMGSERMSAQTMRETPLPEIGNSAKRAEEELQSLLKSPSPGAPRGQENAIFNAQARKRMVDKLKLLVPSGSVAEREAWRAKQIAAKYPAEVVDEALGGAQNAASKLFGKR